MGELRERLFLLAVANQKDGHDRNTATAHDPRQGMSESPNSLRALAQKCRSLVTSGSMDNVAAALSEIALDYDRQADRMEKSEARARERLARR